MKSIFAEYSSNVVINSKRIELIQGDIHHRLHADLFDSDIQIADPLEVKSAVGDGMFSEGDGDEAEGIFVVVQGREVECRRVAARVAE